MLKKATLPGLLLAVALAMLAAPDSRLSAAECGGPGEQLCKENESCVKILFYEQCTTTSDYWSEEAPDEEEPDGEEPGGGTVT